jgi:hypothetical protein
MQSRRTEGKTEFPDDKTPCGWGIEAEKDQTSQRSRKRRDTKQDGNVARKEAVIQRSSRGDKERDSRRIKIKRTPRVKNWRNRNTTLKLNRLNGNNHQVSHVGEEGEAFPSILPSSWEDGGPSSSPHIGTWLVAIGRDKLEEVRDRIRLRSRPITREEVDGFK